MKIHRVYAVILRHLYNFRHSYDRMSDAFYWPTIDLLLWGLTSAYFVEQAPNAAQVMFAIIGGILFWIITWRAQTEISINLLVDVWDRNLVNLFVSPLKFSEWVAGLLFIGITKAMISLSFASVVAFLLYQFNIFYFGFYIIPFILSLLISGWWIGLLIAAVIIRYGTKIQTLGWTVPWAVAPFSAIYFPVSILPEWAQVVSRLLPTSYIFEGIRELVFQHSFNPQYFWISMGLNCIYFVAALFIMKTSFKNALNRGLQTVS